MQPMQPPARPPCETRRAVQAPSATPARRRPAIKVTSGDAWAEEKRKTRRERANATERCMTASAIKCNQVAMQLSCEFCHIRGDFAKSEYVRRTFGEGAGRRADGKRGACSGRACTGEGATCAGMALSSPPCLENLRTAGACPARCRARVGSGNRLPQCGVGHANGLRNQPELEERIGNALLGGQYGFRYRLVDVRVMP